MVIFAKEGDGDLQHVPIGRHQPDVAQDVRRRKNEGPTLVRYVSSDDLASVSREA
jgi:hypothetical protein